MQPQAATRGRYGLDELKLAASGQPREQPRADRVEDTSDGEAQLVDQSLSEERLREGDAGVDTDVSVGESLQFRNNLRQRA